jgi:hypothetical protein
MADMPLDLMPQNQVAEASEGGARSAQPQT